MPRCAAGNHFAAKEGDKNCSACKENIEKSKDAPSVGARAELPLLAVKTVTTDKNTSIDEAFHNFKKGKKKKHKKDREGNVNTAPPVVESLNENSVNDTLTALEDFHLRFPHTSEQYAMKDKGLKTLLTYLKKNQVSPETLTRIYELVRLKTDPQTGEILYHERERQHTIANRERNGIHDEGYEIMSEVLSHPNCPQETLTKSVEDYKSLIKNREKHGYYIGDGTHYAPFKGSLVVPKALGNNPNAQKQVKELKKLAKRVRRSTRLRRTFMSIGGTALTLFTFGIHPFTKDSVWHRREYVTNTSKAAWANHMLDVLNGTKGKKWAIAGGLYRDENGEISANP